MRAAVWTRRLLVAVVIIIAGVMLAGLLLWLESQKQWWTEALASYVLVLLMTGAGIGAYAGWALDDVDEPRTERQLLAIVLLSGLLIPLLFVIAKQVFTVPFDKAPGDWPRWADIIARVTISAPGFGLEAALVVVLARRSAKRSVCEVPFWGTGVAFFLSLLLLGLWPWLGTWFPAWARGVSLLGLISIAVLFSKRIERAEAPPAG